MNRRDLLKASAAGALALAATGRAAFSMNEKGMGMQGGMKMEPPWAWQRKHGVVSPVRKDADPTTDELRKYPRCPYCGMSREMWSHTRHLVQYDDGTAEGTCSIRCVAVALALNLDRGPARIWVGDAGSPASVKPLIDAEKAHYSLVPGKMGTMTRRRKWAFSDKGAAAAQGGEVVSFEAALQAAYEDLGRDTAMVRARRAEKRAHMMRKMKMMRGK